MTLQLPGAGVGLTCEELKCLLDKLDTERDRICRLIEERRQALERFEIVRERAA